MKDQTIAIQQMHDIASKLQIKQYDFSYVPDKDQLLITIRESNDVVKKLKEKSQLILECSFLKELNVFAFAIHLDVDKHESIIASCDPREDLINYLEKVANGKNTIQFIVVGEDLNLISSRHCFDSELAKLGISHALKQYKN